MQLAAKILAPLGLALTVVPPVLFAFHMIPAGPLKQLMLAGCALWFLAAPLWMKGGAE
jgi:hypothetical protein